MKLFESLLENFKDLKKESYLSSLLLQYNVQNIFKPIYAYDNTVQRFGDVCTGFIILGYSNGCPWLDYHKDRRTVKLEVIASVIEALEITMDDKLKLRVTQIIDGEIEAVEVAIFNFVLWQGNGLFQTYIGVSNQISLCQREAASSFGVNAKILNDRGKFLENLQGLQKYQKELIAEIKKEFRSLDESLKQEDKKPISEKIDDNSWEADIQKRIMQDEENKRRKPLPLLSGDKE